jgi:hypothetical protein
MRRRKALSRHRFWYNKGMKIGWILVVVLGVIVIVLLGILFFYNPAVR